MPRIFGCHCRSERSFYYKGKKFPICARCTGELVGIFLSLITCVFFRLSVKLSIIIMIPMVVDGVVQLLTKYESTNLKRFITGLLFGYGLCTLFVISTIEVGKLGFNYGRSLRKK